MSGKRPKSLLGTGKKRAPKGHVPQHIEEILKDGQEREEPEIRKAITDRFNVTYGRATVYTEPPTWIRRPQIHEERKEMESQSAASCSIESVVKSKWAKAANGDKFLASRVSIQNRDLTPAIFPPIMLRTPTPPEDF